MPKPAPDIEITAFEVARWFRDASPKKGPWPTEAQCMDFARKLDNIRRAKATGKIRFAGVELDVGEEKTESDRLKKLIATRAKCAREFLAVLREDIQSLDEDHQSYLEARLQVPEAYWGENSEYLEEKNALIRVVEMIEGTRDIWELRQKRGENEWHSLAAMITDSALELWDQSGEQRPSLHATGPTIQFVQAALVRVDGYHDAKAIESAMERWRKNHGDTRE